MQKIYSAFLICFLCSLFPLTPGYGAEEFIDVIYLKNGGIVKGTIIEVVPEKSIKIRTKDGNVFVFKMSEVESYGKLEVKKEREIEKRYIVEEKNPAVAFVLSFLIPGVGQLYNGEIGKGIAMLGLDIGGWVVALANVPGTEYYYDPYTDEWWYTTTGNEGLYWTGLFVSFGTWIWSMIDAPISANRINREIWEREHGHLFEFNKEKYGLGIDLIPNRNGISAQLTLHF